MLLLYKRYLDDTSVIFSSRSESWRFFYIVNQLHPAFTFTCEFENILFLLDILVNRTNFDIQTSVYHKPSFIGSYTRWGSFFPFRRKSNLIKELVHRALMICSKQKLADDLKCIKTTLLKNGYPEDIITTTIRYKFMQFSTNLKFWSERCPVYLRLPWIGNASLRLLKQIKRSVKCRFNSVKLQPVLNSDVLFPPNKKDSASIFQKEIILFTNFHANTKFATLSALLRD